MIDKIKSALFGLAIGDALGVPVEFKSREKLQVDPITTMTGYGSWNQPPGTWSDDSSLAFCLAESLTKGYDLDDIASNFIKWNDTGYWGARHKLFDIGGATRFAIERLKNGTAPTISGGMFSHDNGNGSLMRILPLLFYINKKEIEERYQFVKEVSSITHAHFRSVFSCFIYMELAMAILNGNDLRESIGIMQTSVSGYLNGKDFNPEEIALFNRLLQSDISEEPETSIHSSGYVLHTLEAAVWCLLTTNNYADAVCKAINLGGDTDTTGCVTGGLASLLYGYDTIPGNWIDVLARKDDIGNLCERLNKQINS